ncbi:HlyD family efflux transporter periplasmic adaptor subunit [Dickeya chrysanthemi]|uniref:HlyD family efflux transporter periplasmic adaptor subunit n=1 Tax=Dickeya chrysanthemi TaxID=556 RepID=UPI000532ABB1|nr:HlyD family efflux transporter periplasmic adaptor subunit [Dickeya chrysanthemi]
MRLAKFVHYLNTYVFNHHPQASPTAGQAYEENTPRLIRLSIWTMLAFMLFLIGWAAVAKMDEVVFATGKTLSQSPRYRVQATQAGELSDLYVHEGQLVNTGTPLMQLENMQQNNASDQTASQLSLIVSPIRGIIKHILVDTNSEQIRPGSTLMEITPLDDTLLIEAQVRLQDIAFLRPGQEAMMAFTTYDYTIFGRLKGYIEQIGQDMVTDQTGNSFYLVQLRTEKNYLGTIDKPLLILSGMPARVDIITGRKTLLSYLLKPIRQARAEALRER